MKRYVPEAWNGNIRLDMAFGPFTAGRLLDFIVGELDHPAKEVRIRLVDEDEEVEESDKD